MSNAKDASERQASGVGESVSPALTPVDVSIEYSHIYTDQQFGLANVASVEELHRGIHQLGHTGESFQTVVMIDNYSPGGDLVFDYDAFLARLDHLGASPGVVIKEGDLLADNHQTLARITDRRLRKQLLRYIDKRGKHPCSLFIATWYLVRLGILTLATPDNAGIMPASRLVNILPQHFKEHEERAADIIASVAGPATLDRIDTIYLDGHYAEPDSLERDDLLAQEGQDERGNSRLWDRFDPEAYVFANYVTMHPFDLYTLASWVAVYRRHLPLGHVLDVGTGSGMMSILAALPYCASITTIEIGAQNRAYLAQQQQQLDPVWDGVIAILRALDPRLVEFDFQSALAEKWTVSKGSLYKLPKHQWDVAQMHYVAESITSDYSRFALGCKSLREAIHLDGLLIASFMENSENYSLNGVAFPVLSIEVEDVRAEFYMMRETHRVMIDRIPIGVGRLRDGHTGVIQLVAESRNAGRPMTT